MGPRFITAGESDEDIAAASLLKQSAAKTLTNAQILALPTAAIEIIPAQGANTIIVPQFAWLYLHWVADYDNIGSTSRLGFEYGTSSASTLVSLQEAIASSVSNLLVDGASHPAFLGLNFEMNTAASGVTKSGVGQFLDDPDTINSAIKIYAVNSGSHTGNFTGGNAGNTLQVSVSYLVWNITTGQFV